MSRGVTRVVQSDWIDRRGRGRGRGVTRLMTSKHHMELFTVLSGENNNKKVS